MSTPAFSTDKSSWFMIRDCLLGENFFSQDIELAVHLAFADEEAQWLAHLLCDVSTKEEAHAVLVKHEQQNVQALCLAALILGQEDETKLRRAAELNDGFAQSKLAWMSSSDKERSHWANLSVSNGERDGFFVLGRCVHKGKGIEFDRDRARHLYGIAAQLGNVEAMFFYGWTMEAAFAARFEWIGKAVECGFPPMYLFQTLVERVSQFNEETFVLGRLLSKTIDFASHTLYGLAVDPDVFECAVQAVEFFELQVFLTKKAIIEWSLVGKRKHLPQNVVFKVSLYIWASRSEANYEN